MRVHWTESALLDLREIYQFIVQDNPTAADDLLARLLAAGDALRSMPNRGRPARRRSLRELVVTRLPYILTYHVSKDGVAIIRVRHGARNRL